MKNLKFVESVLGTTYLVSNFMFALVDITPLLVKAYLLVSLSFIVVYLLCVITGNRKFHDFYVFVLLMAVISSSCYLYPQLKTTETCVVERS